MNIEFHRVNAPNVPEPQPPQNKMLLLYDTGAFYMGTFSGKYFQPIGICSYPAFWADCLPESETEITEFFNTLTMDDEPDGWSKAYYERKRKQQ